jgi:hypothetical protein
MRLPLLLLCAALVSCVTPPKAAPPEMVFDCKSSNAIKKKVNAIYWSLSDPHRIQKAADALLALSSSPSVNDRRGAAYTTGEMSNLFDPQLVQTLLLMHLNDPDSGVRFLALQEFTCTGYDSTFLKPILPKLKELRRDPEPKVRDSARRLCKRASRYYIIF